MKCRCSGYSICIPGGVYNSFEIFRDLMSSKSKTFINFVGDTRKKPLKMGRIRKPFLGPLRLY